MNGIAGVIQGKKRDREPQSSTGSAKRQSLGSGGEFQYSLLTKPPAYNLPLKQLDEVTAVPACETSASSQLHGALNIRMCRVAFMCAPRKPMERQRSQSQSMMRGTKRIVSSCRGFCLKPCRNWLLPLLSP